MGVGLRRRRRGMDQAARFVENGGTLLAIGYAVETARELSICRSRGAARGARRASVGAQGGDAMRNRRRRQTPNRALRDAFSSPARLMQMLRDRVADPRSSSTAPARS